MKTDNIDDFLISLERGQLSVDLMNEIRGTLTALAQQGEAKGHVTLKLNFSVKSDFVGITPEITSKVPKPKRRTSNMWVDDDGNPCSSDPRRVDMFERAATKPRAVVTVDG